MLERRITQTLSDWKNRPGHHPLILRGIRQTGKTTSVRDFGEHNYENTVYLDLRKNRTVHAAFDGNFEVNDMVMAITASDPSARFVPGKTLLILDEIQDCPNARSSLKYWDIDGRYDVIAAGSFLGVKGFRRPYTSGVPVGYEEELTMHPLTFEEFIVNIGINSSVTDHVRQSIEEGTMINKTVHESFRRYYLQYLTVGGMPEAVSVFLDTHDLNQVKEVQRRIIASVSDDFGRYIDADGNEKINEVLKLRARSCLESLPAQLSKEYKKFQYSLVNARGNSTEKADGLQYLTDLGLVYKAYNLKEISLPLESNKIANEFKVYMADTGLLVSMMEQGTAAAVLEGNLGAYKGAIAENMVAGAFSAMDLPLYYYHAPSGSPELDFIYSSGSDAVIMECKATNNRATSMKYVLKNPARYGSHPAVKIADTNVGAGEGFRTYPLYSLCWLLNQTENSVVEIPDAEALNNLPL